MKFLRELKYTALSMLVTIEGLFWTVIYPIIMASLFFVIFSAINMRGVSTAITVGVSETNTEYALLQLIPVLTIIPMEHVDADVALRSGSIQAFIENDLSIRIYKTGLAQTIVKGIVEQIRQANELDIPVTPSLYRKQFIDSKNEQNNAMMLLFYSLLAMVAVYSMFSSLSIPERIQANISKLAVRMSAAPLKRFRIYLAGALCFTLFNLVSNCVYIGFVMLVLQINLITDFTATALLLIYANLFGTAFGLCIGSIPKMQENAKIMLCVFSALFLAFLSGMMGIGIKDTVDSHFPWFSKISPIALLTDSLYNVNILHEYSIIHPFFIVYTIGILLFLSIAFFNAREVQYDSL